MKRTGRHAGGEAGWGGPGASEAVADSDTYLAQSANLPSQARLAARQLAQARLGRPRFDFSGGMDADAERRSERCRGGSRVTQPVGREDRRLGIIFRCSGRLGGVRDGKRAYHLSCFPCREQSTRKIGPEKYSGRAGPTQAWMSRVGRPPSARGLRLTVRCSSDGEVAFSHPKEGQGVVMPQQN